MFKQILLLLFIFSLSGCSNSKEPSNIPEKTKHSTNLPNINTALTFNKFINNSECNQIIDKEFYKICYDYNLKAAKAVSYILSGDLVNELNIKKRPSFKVEWEIDKKYRASTSDYTRSGYTKGHIASDAAFDWSNESLESTYTLANIMPQASNVNQHTWTKAERYERFIAVQLGTVNVVNLLTYSKAPIRIGTHGIAVPTGYYKILFNNEKNYTRCLYYENNNNIIVSEDKLKNHEVSCLEIR